MAVFLPLYFNGYWRTGRRLLGTVAGCLLIGIVWLPFTPERCPSSGTEARLSGARLGHGRPSCIVFG